MKTYRSDSTLWGAVKATGVAALLATTALTGVPAQAADSTATLQKQVQMLQQQLQQLQQQLDAIQSNEAATKDAVAKEATQRKAYEDAEKAAIINAGGKVIAGNGTEVPVPASPPNVLQNKGIKLTFGGFIAAEGVYRNRNETADIGSSFANVPFPNSPNYHLSEFRGTARQSRLSIMAQGAPDDDTLLTAYYEMDFLGAAPTANSVESNSYNPRIRNIYATVDQKMGDDMGFHFLAGQSWTLATMNKVGLLPRSEQVPLTIDAQYVVGFNWLRNPEVRAVWDWDKKWWLAVAADSPQGVIGGTAPGGAAVAPALTTTNAGAAQLQTLNKAYTTDPAPDLTVKVAADPGFGHYELYGITRWFRDRAALANITSHGEGVGGSVLIPVIEKGLLDLQATFLYGKGLGRYGSGQLSDVTYEPSGKFIALPYRSALFGAVSQVDPSLQLYLYAGTEQLKKRFYAGNIGYGAPGSTTVSGCLTESVGTCTINDAREYQVSGGFWYNLYKGGYGRVAIGLQDSYEKLYIFSANAGVTPHTNFNQTYVSFRYYPF